jgi:AsmA protein
MKKALAGSGRIELRDGAVKGFSLSETLGNVKSLVGGKPRTDDPSKRTEFSEITASFAIKGGVARNDDLQGKAPLFRLAGAGDADIGNNAINYVAKASIVATSKGQGGKDLSHLAGVTVPVKLTGPLDKPDWSIDYAELIAKGGAGKVVEKLGGALGGAVGGAAGGAASGAGAVGQKLKGLFGR